MLCAFCFLSPLKRNQPVHIQEGHHGGDHVTEDGFHPWPDLQAFAGVGFGHEVVPAPAELVAAEQRKDQRAYGQQVGGNDEVPEVQPCGALREGLEFEHAVAQGCGEGDNKYGLPANDAAHGTRPAGLFANHGQDIFEDG